MTERAILEKICFKKINLLIKEYSNRLVDQAAVLC